MEVERSGAKLEVRAMDCRVWLSEWIQADSEDTYLIAVEVELHLWDVVDGTGVSVPSQDMPRQL